MPTLDLDSAAGGRPPHSLESCRSPAGPHDRSSSTGRWIARSLAEWHWRMWLDRRCWRATSEGQQRMPMAVRTRVTWRPHRIHEIRSHCCSRSRRVRPRPTSRRPAASVHGLRHSTGIAPRG